MAPHRILIVDDDLLVRLNTVEILEAAGFEVIEACDVGSALVALKRDPRVGLVCTDVNMPGEINGIDLAMEVRNRRPEIKVIVMSGCSKRYDCPADMPFIAKPFRSNRLVELVREQLGVLV